MKKNIIKLIDTTLGVVWSNLRGRAFNVYNVKVPLYLIVPVNTDGEFFFITTKGPNGIDHSDPFGEIKKLPIGTWEGTIDVDFLNEILEVQNKMEMVHTD